MHTDNLKADNSSHWDVKSCLKSAAPAATGNRARSSHAGPGGSNRPPSYRWQIELYGQAAASPPYSVAGVDFNGPPTGPASVAAAGGPTIRRTPTESPMRIDSRFRGRNGPGVGDDSESTPAATVTLSMPMMPAGASPPQKQNWQVSPFGVSQQAC